jgi:hypothetical protein
MSGRIHIEAAENGKPTIVYKVAGKRITLYSRHDPEEDGRRFYEMKKGEYGKELSGLLFFIGLGLGYHILPFAEDPLVERIVILEPDGDVFREAKKTESVKSLLMRDDVDVHVGGDIDQFLHGIEHRYDFVFLDAFHIIRYPRLHRIHAEAYEVLERDLHGHVNSLLSDASTIGRFAALWINNYLKNICQPGTSLAVQTLFDRFSGTAVVLGAGPSLDNVLSDLASDHATMFLIATDAALKPLLRRGIRPSLVVSMDPGHSVFYHVNGLREDVVASIPAVLNLICSPHAFSRAGCRYLYETRHALSHIPGVRLFNYTAVSTLACALAGEMGFDNLVLAGFDFAFTRMRAYACETFFYDYCIHTGHRLKPPHTVEMDSMFRRGAGRLHSYRSELEALLGKLRIKGNMRIYNWQSDGSHIRHTEHIAILPEELKSYRGRGKSLPAQQLSSPNSPCEATIRRFLENTLSLRYRIFKHEPNRQGAEAAAHGCMHKICDRTERGFKV